MVKRKPCAALGCNAVKVPKDGKLMCPFPKPGPRQDLWVQGCGDVDLVKENPMTIHLNKYVCPAHFTNDMFWDKFKSKLRIGAVPTCFEFPPLNETDMLRFKNRDVQFFSAQPAPSNSAADEDAAPRNDEDAAPRNLSGLLIDDHLPDPNPADSEIPPPSTPPPEQLENGKRPRVEDEDDEDEVDDLMPSNKNPRLDIPPPEYSRRSLLRIGARERDGRQIRCSMQQLANECQAPVDSPAVKTAAEYRALCLHLMRKLRVAQREKKDITKVMNKSVLDMVSELTISKAVKDIVVGELRNFKRKKKARRWTLHEKLFWLSVWKRGTRVYRFLARYITLPGETSLKLLLQKVHLEPGVSTPFLKILQKKVQAMKHKDKQCVLLFDEVFLRGRLFHDVKKNIVHGFENYGPRGRTNFIADHALVFMAQGVHQKWTQPVAYYFVSKTCPSQMLKLLIKDVLRSLFAIGLSVVSTVSDQGPNNRGAISELRKDSGGDSIMYSVDGKNLVHIWDMPHILKNVRNNLLSSDIEFNGQRARWRDFIEFYKYDEAVSKMSNLTMRHVNPQGRDKMRVSYAAQVFSASVAKWIRAIVQISDERKLTNCLHFAQLCENIDMCFDLCNGPRLGGNEKSTPYRVNISSNSPHQEKWSSMLSILKSWTFIRKKGGARHVPPCVTGWIENVSSFKVLWCRLVRDTSVNVKVLRLRNFNQDAIENFFSLIRQCGGSSSDLTCGQFTSALKTCMISRFSTLTSSDKNCLDDDSFLATDLSECLISDGEGDEESETVEALCRGDTPANFGRRAKVQESNPSARQAPTALWCSAIGSISEKINCNCCRKLLFTSKRSLDTLSSCSSATVFPSRLLVSKFLTFQNSFERQFKRLMYKDNVQTEVTAFCLGAADWEVLFCPLHQNSEIKSSVVEKAVLLMIQQKCEDCNKELRDKVSRRTRQADSYKDNNGLRNTEEELTIDPEDLDFLVAPQQVPVPATLTASTSRTPLMAPAHTPLRTPLTTPAPTPVLRTPGINTPAGATPVQTMTPRQEARNKVQKAWITPLATPSNATAKTLVQTMTPCQEATSRRVQVESTIPSDEKIRQMIGEKSLKKLTVNVLKNILRSKNLYVTGNKDILVERLTNHF